MKKKYKIVITSQATRQLTEIRDYILYKLCSPDVAEKTLLCLKNAILSLENFPKRIPLSEYEKTEREIRKMIVKNYLIYFFVDDMGNKVVILAVIYARREQSNICLDEYNAKKNADR